MLMMNVPGGGPAAVMMMGHSNGRCPRNSLYSDCIIEEKTVVLQKKDNEGFGFVLRGAKADTPIEEFTPTPAFPALQYLESVDEGGVAWQAGLRTGDFLIEVNSENVVKVGHRQVVNMIRQGGNHLVLKVVTVTRSLDPDDTARKKAPPPPKRAPTTALTLRSKSMTSELEELDKPDEIVPAPKPSRAAEAVVAETRVATIKQRPTSRCFPSVSDMNSVFERQGIAVMTPTVPGSPKGPFLGLPRGTMRRQKSIGKQRGRTRQGAPWLSTAPGDPALCPAPWSEAWRLYH
uniref:SH3 and multiple ankyrin repeat domains 2 n=1 Tax=Sus scrofa TaxID=9823 RepID=A0A5G2QQP7_PIG